EIAAQFTCSTDKRFYNFRALFSQCRNQEFNFDAVAAQLDGLGVNADCAPRRLWYQGNPKPCPNERHHGRNLRRLLNDIWLKTLGLAFADNQLAQPRNASRIHYETFIAEVTEQQVSALC